MKILVTGAQGQVARSLVAARSAHQVVAVGRPELDIADATSVRSCICSFAPDVVVNAAAYTAVDKAESDAEGAAAVNADGARNVAMACVDRGIPIVHISTDYVFDGTKAGSYLEVDSPSPLGVYGRTKLAGENAVAAANPRHVILRTAWVFSPYGQNFVKTMLRLAAARPQLSVVDDQHGSPTYAPHLADAILALLTRMEQQPQDIDWGIFHAAGDGETTWCGLAREVFQVLREAGGPNATVIPIPTLDYPTPAKRPANSRLDCRKLKRTFGIVLPHWTAGVAQCVPDLLSAAQQS